MPSILRPLQLDDSTPETPPLAKSRRPSSSVVTPPPRRVVKSPVLEKKQRVPLAEKDRDLRELPGLNLIPWKSYILHLPILLIGLALYAAILFIFMTVEPRLVQNVWLPNSYAPLLVLVALANFCFFSFVFLNTRRGFLSSLLLLILLFLKLQQVLTTEIILWTAVVIVVAEVSFILLHLLILSVRPRLNLPALPKVPQWRQFTLKPHKELPIDLADSSKIKSHIELPKPTSRHGRKRKHHFFGK